jgi:hypothetical protein
MIKYKIIYSKGKRLKTDKSVPTTGFVMSSKKSYHERYLLAKHIQSKRLKRRLEKIVGKLNSTDLFKHVITGKQIFQGKEVNVTFEEMQEYIQDPIVHSELNRLLRLLLGKRPEIKDDKEDIMLLRMQIRRFLCGLLLLTHANDACSSTSIVELVDLQNTTRVLWRSIIQILKQKSLNGWEVIARHWDIFLKEFQAWQPADSKLLLEKVLDEYLALQELEELILGSIDQNDRAGQEDIEREWKAPLDARKAELYSMIRSMNGTNETIQKAKLTRKQTRISGVNANQSDDVNGSNISKQGEYITSSESHNTGIMLSNSQSQSGPRSMDLLPTPCITQLVHEMYLEGHCSREALTLLFPRAGISLFKQHDSSIGSRPLDQLPLSIVIHWHAFILRTIRDQLTSLIESSFTIKPETSKNLIINLVQDLDLTCLEGLRIDSHKEETIPKIIVPFLYKVFEWMGKLCAPVRDQAIKDLHARMVSNQDSNLDYQKFYDDLLDLLYEMKLDLLVFGLDLIKYRVRQLDYVVQLERKTWKEMFFSENLPSLQVSQTKERLLERLFGMSMASSSKNSATYVIIDSILYLDHARLSKWNRSIQSMALYMTLITIFRQQISQPGSFHSLFMTDSDVLWTLPEYATISNEVSSQTQHRSKILDTLLSRNDSDIEYTIQETHPVFRVFHQRVKDYLVQFLDFSKNQQIYSILESGTASKPSKRSPLPDGILMAQDKRLAAFIQPPHSTLQSAPNALHAALDNLTHRLVRWIHLHLTVHQDVYTNTT